MTDNNKKLARHWSEDPDHHWTWTQKLGFRFFEKPYTGWWCVSCVVLFSLIGRGDDAVLPVTVILTLWAVHICKKWDTAPRPWTVRARIARYKERDEKND